GLAEVVVNAKYKRFRKFSREIGRVNRPNTMEEWWSSWFANVKVSGTAPDKATPEGFLAFSSNRNAPGGGASKISLSSNASETQSFNWGHQNVYAGKIRQVGIATTLWKEYGASIDDKLNDFMDSPDSNHCVETIISY